jgi:hypothetical protein
MAEGLSAQDRIAVHKAGVLLAAGHLRSQIRYHALKKAVPLDDPGLVLTTRTSNALDFALLVQDLVPLLEAYERAGDAGDEPARIELADAICQGLSPDPDLFVNRIELLGAYSMLEHLFVATDHDGHAAYTAMGRRHLSLLQEYAVRIRRASVRLRDDCPRFRPAAGSYSPYGILYGFATNLLEHMALKTVQADPVTGFSLEDVFTGGTDGARLAWVSGWRKLPHLTREVEALFDYPHQFAEQVFARLEQALGKGVSERGDNAAGTTGRLVVRAGHDGAPGAKAVLESDLPVRYIASSDRGIAADLGAAFQEERSLLSDRREGRCLISYQTAGGWVAISKAVLTDVLGAGRDASIAGLPAAAREALTLMGRGLVVDAIQR